MINFTTADIIGLEGSESAVQFQKKLISKGYKSSSILMLIKNCYSYATKNQFAIEQKQQMLNQVLKLVYDISNLKTSKAEFPMFAKQSILSMAIRNQSNMAPNFTRTQVEHILHFFNEQVLPYYELYELILDSNPQFSFKCEEFEPVPTVFEKRIFEGEVVEVENIDILKDLVGERAPKDQKKQGKKK